MGRPVSLLGQARAFARDYARDAMPSGALWDTMDFVPAIIDAPLTGRGAWKWGSGVNLTLTEGPFLAGILMPFKEGDKLLVADQSNLYQVDITTTDLSFPLSFRGNSFAALQNPVKYNNVAVHFDGAGNNPPQLWPATGAPVASNAAHKHARLGTVYKSMLVSGGAPTEEHVVRFSVPNSDLTQATSFDANSFIPTSLPLTALAALRGMILCFHANSIERIRGTIPPHGTVEKGDMFLEDALDHSGTSNPKSISYWQDNVVFANQLGVHITDGSTVRSLTSQGGISYYWRMLYEGANSIAGTVFLDYYIVTVRHPANRPPPPLVLYSEDGAPLPPPPVFEPRDAPRPPVPPIPPDLPPIRPPVPPVPTDAYNTTLICDLNRRQWYRFSNINSVCYIAGGGTSGMERVWASLGDVNRLARIGPTFYPDFGSIQTDDNGIDVRPRIETAWYRLAEEGRKRVRFAYLSYDVQGEGSNLNPVRVGYVTSPQGLDYVQAGVLPSTTRYSRYRLPVYKFPYGIAFYVETTGKAFAVRIYDLAVEAQPAERSRI